MTEELFATDAYVRLAAAGERIQAFRRDGGFWADIGGLEKLEDVRRQAAERGIPE